MRRFVKNYRREKFESDGVRGEYLYGRVLFDPDALYHPHTIPNEAIAGEHTLPFHMLNEDGTATLIDSWPVR